MLTRSGLLAVAILLLSQAQSRAEDAHFSAGRHGWSLEHFGAEVTLLRSNAVGAEPGPGEAALILSCDGRERRLRLTIPDKSGSLGLGSGSLLIRAIDGAGAEVAHLTAPVSATGRTTLLIAGSEGPDGRDPILAVARMLQTAPAGFDMLLHRADEPFVPSRLIPLRLSLAFGPGESRVFGEFAEVCARSGREPSTR